ncbi:hypothetical protein HG263_08075 [Pseudoalteromonas sp. JBTF-M23]|uniref:ABC-2 type transport system permease protein n=1 Tax=Pseudoalteromonas caenipelagi TaxID=2726988 RepID=A0A849VFJ1_9GAMM|nr:hypothetical protein [Pseudoalteromonas caenipelagi]NOU50497.1 hypothetical protein [Pseudoalteromonas caenipelagi]
MLLRNEFKYAFSQPLLVIMLLISTIACSILGLGALEAGASQQDALQVLSLIQMLILPIMVVISVVTLFLRDVNSNMHELIEATPLKKSKHSCLRFVVHISCVFIPFMISVLLISIQHFAGSEAIEVIVFGLFGLVLPNLIALSSIVILVAIYSSSTFTAYAFTALLAVGYMVLGSALGFPFLSGSAVVSQALYEVMIWFDPFGTTPLLHNGATELLNGTMVINRLMLIGLSIVIVVITLKVQIQSTGAKKKKKTSSSKKVAVTLFNASTPFTAMVLSSLSHILRNRVNQIILLLWAGIATNEVMTGLHSTMQVGAYKSSSLDAINFIASDVLLAFGSITVAMWSCLICWNEKKRGFDEIIATMPTSNSLRLLAQMTSLCVLVGVLILNAAMASLSAELLFNTEIELSQYVSQFAVASIPLLLLSVMFVLIHHLVTSPVKAGAIILAILIVKFTPITSSLGLTHLLWNIAGSPMQEATHFWGFGGSTFVLLSFVAFWLMVIACLYSFAIIRSHRGTGLVNQQPKSRFKSAYVLIVISAFYAFCIHQTLTSEKPLTYVAQQQDWQVYYEKTYRNWAQQPQPELVHIGSEVDIYPAIGSVNITAAYTLVNQSNSNIEQVLIGRYGSYKSWQVQQNAQFTILEDDYGQQAILDLSKPLAPGESLDVNMTVDYQQPSLWPVSTNLVVEPSFTNILTERFLPHVGYQAHFELQDKSARKRYSLGEASTLFNPQRHLSYSSVISTDASHVVISQGKKKAWQQNNRNYFLFESTSNKGVNFIWSSIPKASEIDGTINANVALYLPSHYEDSEQVLTVISELSKRITKELGMALLSPMHIIASPRIHEKIRDVPEVALYDFDSLVRHLSVNNDKLHLVYRYLVPSFVKQLLWSNQLELPDMLTKFLQGHVLLSTVEQQFGLDARKEVVGHTMKQLKLQTLNMVQHSKRTAHVEEQLITLDSILLIQALEELVGKAQLKEMLFKQLEQPSSFTKKGFMQTLINENADSQQQIELAFSKFSKNTSQL